MPSAYRTAVLADNPTYVFPMTDNGNQTNIAGGQGLTNPGGANAPSFQVASNLAITGESSNVLYVDASSAVQFLFGTNNTVFDLAAGDFTLEAWASVDFGGNYATIARLNYTSGAYILRKAPSGVWEGYSGVLVPSTTVRVEDQFYHLAFVRSGGNGLIYVNGVLENTVAGQVNGSGMADLLVGAAPGGTEVYQGGIAWLAGYKTALSGSRIQAHYRAATGGASSTPGIGGIGLNGPANLSNHISV